MDLEAKRFGRGPRELGGAVDLINQYKLWPHYESICRRSIPLSITATHYLHNVVGNTEIRRGEGMELDQLFQNAIHLRKRDADIHVFDLNVLSDAFRMRETTSVNIPLGIPTAMAKLKSELKEKEKKHKSKAKKDHKKHKSLHKDNSSHKKRRLDGVEDLPFHGNKRVVMENLKIIEMGELKVEINHSGLTICPDHRSSH
ncbi:hypothetical protein PanWU01x14_070910 [Parasponia andersonii]|uniref:Uncharacterized protein n=1 Tax=Parasponia andersonii TaxID=3476 RepID=A0A2P5DE96_PARAD|nr:hypothetical protein PanWU01x14_070910 [Parasponia andersonii]